jgi:hypothetical protein
MVKRDIIHIEVKGNDLNISTKKAVRPDGHTAFVLYMSWFTYLRKAIIQRTEKHQSQWFQHSLQN